MTGSTPMQRDQRSMLATGDNIRPMSPGEWSPHLPSVSVGDTLWVEDASQGFVPGVVKETTVTKPGAGAVEIRVQGEAEERQLTVRVRAAAGAGISGASARPAEFTCGPLLFYRAPLPWNPSTGPPDNSDSLPGSTLSEGALLHLLGERWLRHCSVGGGPRGIVGPGRRLGSNGGSVFSPPPAGSMQASPSMGPGCYTGVGPHAVYLVPRGGGVSLPHPALSALTTAALAAAASPSSPPTNFPLVRVQSPLLEGDLSSSLGAGSSAVSNTLLVLQLGNAEAGEYFGETAMSLLNPLSSSYNNNNNNSSSSNSSIGAGGGGGSSNSSLVPPNPAFQSALRSSLQLVLPFLSCVANPPPSAASRTAERSGAGGGGGAALGYLGSAGLVFTAAPSSSLQSGPLSADAPTSSTTATSGDAGGGGGISVTLSAVGLGFPTQPNTMHTISAAVTTLASSPLLSTTLPPLGELMAGLSPILLQQPPPTLAATPTSAGGGDVITTESPVSTSPPVPPPPPAEQQQQQPVGSGQFIAGLESALQGWWSCAEGLDIPVATRVRCVRALLGVQFAYEISCAIGGGGGAFPPRPLGGFPVGGGGGGGGGWGGGV